LSDATRTCSRSAYSHLSVEPARSLLKRSGRGGSPEPPGHAIAERPIEVNRPYLGSFDGIVK
jgi:hypothetical protein